MTHRDVQRQARIVKQDLERMHKIQSAPGGIEKWQKDQAKRYKRWVRTDKINTFIGWYGESNARIMFTFLALAILFPVAVWLIIFNASVSLGRLWDWILIFFA